MYVSNINVTFGYVMNQVKHLLVTHTSPASPCIVSLITLSGGLGPIYFPSLVNSLTYPSNLRQFMSTDNFYKWTKVPTKPEIRE